MTTIQQRGRLASIIDQHPRIFVPPNSQQPITHPVQHYITTQGSPCFSRPRRLFGAKLQVASLF